MESIREKLEVIIKKAQENMKDVWSEDLETVSTAVITSDLDNIDYNGWFDDLVALKDEL
jgi:ketosteroid isomerase-like protein